MMNNPKAHHRLTRVPADNSRGCSGLRRIESSSCSTFIAAIHLRAYERGHVIVGNERHATFLAL